MMNSLQDQFCPVCREQIVHQVYRRLPSLIVDPVPANANTAMHPDENLSFSATVLGPDDGSMELRWSMDGQSAGGGETLDLEGCSEDFEVTLSVTDPTEHVRLDPSNYLTDSFTWTVACDLSLIHI